MGLQNLKEKTNADFQGLIPPMAWLVSTLCLAWCYLGSTVVWDRNPGSDNPGDIVFTATHL